jgi:predicted cobalt transporter CbtA
MNSLNVAAPLVALVAKRVSKQKSSEAFLNNAAERNVASRLGNLVLQVILILIVGLIAGYLSYSSNTAAGWESKGLKGLFGFVAFLFAPMYISNHVLHKIDLLSALNMQNRLSTMLSGRGGERAR